MLCNFSAKKWGKLAIFRIDTRVSDKYEPCLNLFENFLMHTRTVLGQLSRNLYARKDEIILFCFDILLVGFAGHR